jgi:8-hydroxy-5-deazaflavin:NADPH oxidoreductase
MKTTKIGVLGSGDVGKTLAKGFAATGHDVKIGSREPSKLDAWTKSKEGGDGKITTGTFADTAKHGEILVLATIWPGTESAIGLAGAANFKGKLLLDVTNPLKMEGGRPVGLERGFSDSGGEQIQRWLPDARVVKAFNIVGNAHMFKPDFPGGPPDMFFCGNDEAAKKTTTEILESFGWNAVDIGGIDGSRMLEPMCWLWVTYAMKKGGTNHAFKMLRK